MYSLIDFNYNKKDNSQLGHYLAGLIEGDGTIITPKKERSDENKLNYPSIQITFNSKDLSLALVIQKELNFGTIAKQKGVNAYRLTINNFDGVLFIVWLLNGKMKTSKIIDLWKLIDWLNNKFIELNLIKYPLNNELLSSNSWFSGFIDADGHFAVRTTNNATTKRIECKFVIVQSQKDHNDNDKKLALEKIASFLSTKVKSIRLYKPKPEYSITTVNLKGNLELKSYLNEYPLFSSKYLDYIDWLKVLFFFEQEGKKNKHLVNKEKAIKIKSGMNNSRVLFTWNHLQNFYNIER